MTRAFNEGTIKPARTPENTAYPIRRFRGRMGKRLPVSMKAKELIVAAVSGCERPNSP